MNNTAEQQSCPNCGAAIPGNAPQGVCPKCLMAAAAVSTEAGETGGKRPEPLSLERLAAAFPQLEVIKFIGQGGMGAVYKARQKQLDRIVALKVLPPGIGGDPSFAERFTREAKALAKLLHPNIVALFEFGQADGIYYLLMEFVDGVSLGQLLRASRISSREALAIVPQICDALQYAHDQGIVHRDIKPENILLDRRGRVKVADFGLAKLAEPAPLTPSLSQSDGERVAARPGEGKAAVLTGAGKIMGTPNYMAPEQVEHPGEVDHRADIYALGVVFYQMLTGELPGKRMEPPSKKVQIDVRLDEVVMRALEKKPELRYQQVSEVKTIVETIVGDTDAAPAEPDPVSGLTKQQKQEIEQFGRDFARLFSLEGLLSFAKRSLHWIACQGLLLFDFTARPSRFSFWLILLLGTSNIGFMVNGVILAINLAQRLWHPTPPALLAQEWVMFQWMLLFAVGRLAALNLGSKEVAGAAGAKTAKVISARRVVVVLLTLLALTALAFGSALATNWLNKVHMATITDAARRTPWVAVAAAVGVFLVVGWTLFWLFFRLYQRVWRAVRSQVKEKFEQNPNAIGLPAVEAWLRLLDGGHYEQCWESAAPSFQRNISKEEWMSRMGKDRRPLGKVLSRKSHRPQLLAGWTREGAKFVFDTSFDGLRAATETVTTARQWPKGEWKPIGYLIKPAGDGKEESEPRYQQVSEVKTMVESISRSSSPVTGTAPSAARPAATRGRLRAALIVGVLVWLFVAGTVTLITWIRPASWKVVAVISCPQKSQPGRPVEAHFKFIATMIELIQSDVILGRVIDRLQLDERSGKLDERWGKRNLGLKLTKAQAMVWLQRRLDVRSEGGTLIQVGVFGKRPEEPEEAMDIANTIAEELRDFRIEQQDSPAEMLEMSLRFTPPYFLLGIAAAFVLGLLAGGLVLLRGSSRRGSQASQVKTGVETIATDMRSATAPPTGTSARDGAGEAPTRCATKKKKGEFIGIGWAKYAYVGGAVGIPGALAIWFGLHQLFKAPKPLEHNLTQHQFEQLVDSNQVAEASVYYNSNAPSLNEIAGRYYVTDAEGKRLPETDPHAKVPFRTKVRLYPELQARLLTIPQFDKLEGTRNPSLVLFVSATTARKGDLSVRLDTLGTVESSNSVMFVIPEHYCQEVIKKFDAHQALTVEADNHQGERFGSGLLVGVDNRIDTETATLKCRASLIPEGGNLMVPGLFLNIHLLLEVKHGVVFVPADAISHDPQGAFVWAIEPDQTVSVRHVQAGTIDGAKVEIQDGLSPGEVVVTGSSYYLREGQKILYNQVLP